MVSVDMSKANPVRNVVLTAVLLVLAFIGFMVFSASGTISQVQNVEETDVPLFEAAWEIRYLDEVLTQSAARYTAASVGERPLWQDRYDTAAARLDEVFAFALSEASDSEVAFIDSVSAANDRLIALEGQMFSLTDSGNNISARTILEGEYQELKAEYAMGLDGFFDAQSSRIVDSTSSSARAAGTTRIAAGLLAIVMIGVLVKIYNIVEKLIQEKDETPESRSASPTAQMREAALV